jgi:hypothetical protein
MRDASAREALFAFRATRPDYSEKDNVDRFWRLARAAAVEERIQRQEGADHE